MAIILGLGFRDHQALSKVETLIHISNLHNLTLRPSFWVFVGPTWVDNNKHKVTGKSDPYNASCPNKLVTYRGLTLRARNSQCVKKETRRETITASTMTGIDSAYISHLYTFLVSYLTFSSSCNMKKWIFEQL
ncbi:hypothetical protein PanWU01x14_105260 [Parasponia andersonii]|uniref:Uncharacterized protein n=1 Tax=Parasponia andersonii TaxID=3476 RepID=A0A2P5D1F8_PARAD|nr:hypothetical protein PanWU01x14_105260 [Parasponia andersonii]